MPSQIIQEHFTQALVKFMRESTVARDELYLTMERVPDGGEALLDLPSCRKLVIAHALWEAPHGCGVHGLRDRRWNPVRKGPDEYRAGWWIQTAGTPNEVVKLGHVVHPGQRVCVEYSWTIPRFSPACEIPDFIAETWFDVLMDGTKALVHNDPAGEKQFLPKLAAVYDERFKDGIANARSRQEMNYGLISPDPAAMYRGAFGG